jgi:hypothetical protein
MMSQERRMQKDEMISIQPPNQLARHDRRELSKFERWTPLVLRKGLVCETIQPIFSRLSRGDHRMRRCPSVLTGVFIGRRIAAQRHAACLARTQVNPARSDLNALLTLMIFRMLHRLNRADVDAALAIHDRLSFVQVRWIGQVPSKQNLRSYPGFWIPNLRRPLSAFR